MQPRTTPCNTFFRKIGYYFKYAFSLALGYGTSLPNVQYTVTFPYYRELAETSPTQVSFAWFQNLSVPAMTGAFYNAASTVIISGTFGYRYLNLSINQFNQELSLFRQGKNTKRFLQEIILTLFSALSGAAISGAPYVGVMQWTMRITGFIVIGGLSFLGMHDLLVKLTDQDYAFKLKLIDHLKRIHPYHQSEINRLLRGRELNTETINLFLQRVFDLAESMERQKQLHSPEIKEESPSLFREKTLDEMRWEYRHKIGDYAVAGVSSFFCSIIYFESGFAGMNLLTGNSLDNIPTAAKIVIGALPGIPLTLFLFFSMKIFQSHLVESWPEISREREDIAKTAGLISLNIGNAGWYYGLAAMIAKNKNIFSFLLETEFGQTIFPWAAYFASLAVGINGVAPMLFPPKINIHQPEIVDVVKALKHHIFNPTTLQALKEHSFFTGAPRLMSHTVELTTHESKPLL